MLTQRAMTEWVVSWDIHGGAEARDGASSHRAVNTPRIPTKAPTARSAVLTPPNGSTECNLAPTNNPTPWPTKAPPSSSTTASTMVASRTVELAGWARADDSPKMSKTLGMKTTAKYNPAARPTQEKIRARKPIRQPAQAATAAQTRMPMSKRFTGPAPTTWQRSGTRCARPCGGQGGPPGRRYATNVA